MTAIRPLWCIMPDHKPLTRALLDARETTPFTGWRIYPYNPATGAEDSSICILNSNEGVEVAKTLKAHTSPQHRRPARRAENSRPQSAP